VTDVRKKQLLVEPRSKNRPVVSEEPLATAEHENDDETDDERHIVHGDWQVSSHFLG
jgi:hypothetical protein